MGPFIIALSIIIDALIMPSLMMKNGSSFEHKYYNTENISES